VTDAPPVRSNPPPPTPEVEGYVVASFIGRGSSGTVWRATQVGTLREVALKVLAPWQTHGLAPLRFEREAEIAASLEHEAIARVFGAGECPFGPWLAMELVEGPPVDEWIRREQPSLRDRVSFLRLVCAGMSHAHQRGVIHRDLKPGNILVTPDGQPKIVDFGLARRDAPSSLEVSLTREGDFLGTLAWMPPEQASGRWAEVDALSDVHALGAILFALAVGQPPIDSQLPPAAQLAAAQSGERRRLRDVDPAAPRDLEAVVARCLAAGKSHRYQSVAELEADLSRWLAGEPVQAPVGAPFYWLRKKLRRHWPAVAAAAAVTATAVGLAAGYWQGQERLKAEQAAALRREAEQKARTLHDAQEMVTQLLVEMRSFFVEAGHPEWIVEAEQRVAAFPWGDDGGAYDSRRFRGRAALVQGELLSSKAQWGGALSAFHDAIEQLKPLVQENPTVPLFREELIRARLGESQALLKLQYHKEAIRAARHALELCRSTPDQPNSPSQIQALVDAVGSIAEASLVVPERGAAALEVARQTQRMLPPVSKPPADGTNTAKWHAELALIIARLSGRVEERDLFRAAAIDALTLARQFCLAKGDDVVSNRLLASALAQRALSALADGAPDAACTHLNEASQALGAKPPPLSLSGAVHLEVATTWEKAAEAIAARPDHEWAIEAYERALDLHGKLRRRAPSGENMASLSRLCLACLKLALAAGDEPKIRTYAWLTTNKLAAGRRDNTARAPVALDSLEAAILMLEGGRPDLSNPPDAPGWQEVVSSSLQWMKETKPRMTKTSLDREAALTLRLQALQQLD
jgi:tetratricopeptide (TPR) repeat protein